MTHRRTINVEGIPSADDHEAGLAEAAVDEAQKIVNKVRDYVRANAIGSFKLQEGCAAPAKNAILAANRALAPLQWEVSVDSHADSSGAETTCKLQRLPPTGRVDVSRVPSRLGAPSPCDNLAQRIVDIVSAAVSAGRVGAGTSIDLNSPDGMPPNDNDVCRAEFALKETPWRIAVEQTRGEGPGDVRPPTYSVRPRGTP